MTINRQRVPESHLIDQVDIGQAVPDELAARRIAIVDAADERDRLAQRRDRAADARDDAATARAIVDARRRILHAVDRHLSAPDRSALIAPSRP